MRLGVKISLDRWGGVFNSLFPSSKSNLLRCVQGNECWQGLYYLFFRKNIEEIGKNSVYLNIGGSLSLHRVVHS